VVNISDNNLPEIFTDFLGVFFKECFGVDFAF